MISRITRIIRSFIGASVATASPLKIITGILGGVLIPYLLYAFLGGFGLAVAIFGLGWLIWYLAAKKRN